MPNIHTRYTEHYTITSQRNLPRCNAVGVNVIVDLVLNHMAAHGASGVGTAGSLYGGEIEVN